MGSIAAHRFFVFPATGFTMIRASMYIHSLRSLYWLYNGIFIIFGLYTETRIVSGYNRNVDSYDEKRIMHSTSFFISTD